MLKRPPQRSSQGRTYVASRASRYSTPKLDHGKRAAMMANCISRLRAGSMNCGKKAL
ncbi:hypothetical protein D554_0268 [Bordetella holmesii 30539]|nr:hypothetical protein D554_0268 [Bordetella holmesii 30539]